MAEVDRAQGHPAMDYAAHAATYRAFTAMMKWGAILVAILIIALAFFTL
jgi:hypothetical protein